MSFVEDCPKCHGDGVVYRDGFDAGSHYSPCECGKYDPPKMKDKPTPQHATPSSATPNDKHEREMLRTIDQRDAAEEALTQAYYLITGRSPDWSSVWGFAECIEEIDEAQQLLRKLIPSSAMRKLAERAVENQKNDKRTDEQIIEDGASFICGEGFDPPSSATSEAVAWYINAQSEDGLLKFRSYTDDKASVTKKHIPLYASPHPIERQAGEFSKFDELVAELERDNPQTMAEAREWAKKVCAEMKSIPTQAGEFVSVPREPTTEMIYAGIEAMKKAPDLVGIVDNLLPEAVDCYKAMLAAALSSNKTGEK